MDKSWWVDVLLLLTLLVCGIDSQAPVFIVHPDSTNTIEGTRVEFLCLANMDPTSLEFLVDGSVAGVDPTKGFDEQPIVIVNSDTLSRTLRVNASVADNDNSMIKCQANNTESSTTSDTAILRVQGPLSSVVNLSYSFIDFSSVNISWSPPFTLPGIDITGYNISATSNGTTTNYFTSNSYYELSLTDITNSSKPRIYVNVSGYNGLDGESTVLVDDNDDDDNDIDELYLPRVPPSSELLTIFFNISFNQFSDILQLILSNIDASDLFPGECPIHANIMLSSSNGVNTISITFSTCTELIRILSPNITSIDLTRYLSYTATVSYSNLAGSFGITSDFSFNTYDLVSAVVIDSLAMCSFSSFSIDNAECTFELESANSSLNFTLTLSKPTASNIIEERISIPGLNSTELFYITVYDPQEPNPPRFNFSCFIEPIQPNATDATPSDTTSDTPSNSTDPPSNTPYPTVTEPPKTGVIIIIILVILIIVVIIVVATCYCYCKNKSKKLYPTENKRGSSDGLVGSSSFTDRSPTNPPPNMEAMYSMPNMEAKTGKAPIVYAELSGFNKSHPTNGAGQQPPQSKKDNSQVVYSDLLIKGQPPPPPYEPTEIRETRLHSSATVITKTMITHPDEDIEEIFFHHPDNDSDKEDSPSPVYPPAPTGRAPSPPEDSAPPVPSRYHGVNPLPDVVRQHNRPDSEEGFTDESMNPYMGTLTEKQDGVLLNTTPAATYL